MNYVPMEMDANIQALINISAKRLCTCADPTTRKYWEAVLEAVKEYDEDIYVNADYSKISQVIYNLVNNAINYSRTDKHIIVRQSRKDKNVLIEVIDHGEGIDQEHLENIWDRYYKVDKEHKSSVVGTGLGLSIVKNVLDRHNAHYGVKSVVGEGSNFWFELEIADSPE